MIVAAHAIVKDFSNLAEDRSWYLEPYQTNEGPLFVEHVRRGVELAARDPGALLLFSGGQTRREAGPRNEALSYYKIAAGHLAWLGAPELESRASTEEFARDSFENLLFSVCRFREITGVYPLSVEFVTWAFKEPRLDLHRQAMRFPKGRFRFDGPNDPPDLPDVLPQEEKTLASFRADPYGTGATLGLKRQKRNPFCRQHGYMTSCPEISMLLQHAGPELFSGPLPWD